MPKPITQRTEVETEVQDENLVPVRKAKAPKAKKAKGKAATKAAGVPAAKKAKADRPERKVNAEIPLAERKQIFLVALRALGATSATKAATKESVVAKAGGKLFPLDVYRMGRHEMATEGLVGQAKLDGQGLCYYIMARGLKAIGK